MDAFIYSQLSKCGDDKLARTSTKSTYNSFDEYPRGLLNKTFRICNYDHISVSWLVEVELLKVFLKSRLAYLNFAPGNVGRPK